MILAKLTQTWFNGLSLWMILCTAANYTNSKKKKKKRFATIKPFI